MLVAYLEKTASPVPSYVTGVAIEMHSRFTKQEVSIESGVSREEGCRPSGGISFKMRLLHTNVWSNIIPIESHSSFCIRDVTKESRDEIDFRWTPSYLSRPLCISSAGVITGPLFRDAARISPLCARRFSRCLVLRQTKPCLSEALLINS